MRSRCSDQFNPMFHLYGARGISVCARWDKFENFLADMGVRPKGKSIDRINNARGYHKSNCRWATPKEQARNRRTNVWIRWRGSKWVLKDICAVLGISYSRAKNRQSRGDNLRQILDPSPRLVVGRPTVGKSSSGNYFLTESSLFGGGYLRGYGSKADAVAARDEIYASRKHRIVRRKGGWKVLP